MGRPDPFLLAWCQMMKMAKNRVLALRLDNPRGGLSQKTMEFLETPRSKWSLFQPTSIAILKQIPVDPNKAEKLLGQQEIQVNQWRF